MIRLELVAGSESAGDQLVFLLPAVGNNNHIAMPQDVQEDQSQRDLDEDFESVHQKSLQSEPPAFTHGETTVSPFLEYLC